MTVKKGDFISIDFVAKIKETGETFDTTIQEVAKKERIHREGYVYEPMLVVVGEGWVLKGLDDELVGLEVDKPSKIELSPAKAFGSRDPSKLKLIPLRRFKTEDTPPRSGQNIEIDGKLAVVRSVGAGRVQVDFNPPLAGKTLVYELTVKKSLESKEEKIKALVHRRIQAVALDKFGLKLVEKEVAVEIPEEAFLMEGLQYAKRGIATDIQKFFPEIESVAFTETFKKKPPVAKPQVKPAQVSEAPAKPAPPTEGEKLPQASQ